MKIFSVGYKKHDRSCVKKGIVTELYTFSYLAISPVFSLAILCVGALKSAEGAWS